MRKVVVALLAVAVGLSLLASCSGKSKVVTGTKYKCKECGKIYRDNTREIEVDKSMAKEFEAKTVDGYCPKCGDELITLDQIQKQKCPVCGADMGTVTKKIQIQRKLADSTPKEAEIAVTCNKSKCARVGALHAKYNWEWNICAAVAEQQLGFGYDEAMVREAWGAPKSVESLGNAKKWIYDSGYVVIGPSGKVTQIKQ